jgi:hypothetical protein
MDTAVRGQGSGIRGQGSVGVAASPHHFWTDRLTQCKSRRIADLMDHWPLTTGHCFATDHCFGAIEGTRTPTPLPVHGPEPCASANSATMASGLTLQRRLESRRRGRLHIYSTEAKPGVKPAKRNPRCRPLTSGTPVPALRFAVYRDLIEALLLKAELRIEQSI